MKGRAMRDRSMTSSNMNPLDADSVAFISGQIGEKFKGISINKMRGNGNRNEYLRKEAIKTTID